MKLKNSQSINKSSNYFNKKTGSTNEFNHQQYNDLYEISEISINNKKNFNKQNANTIHLGNIIKKVKFNNSINLVDSNRRSSNHFSKMQYQQNFENMEPSELVEKLKDTINDLRKKESNHRFLISKLKKQVSDLTTENANLKQTIKMNNIRQSKDNQYILKLDIELRNSKEQLLKLKKNNQKNDKSKELEDENQEMRFVIKQLLNQIQTLKAEKKLQIPMIQTVNYNQKTFPSQTKNKQQSFDFVIQPIKKSDNQKEPNSRHTSNSKRSGSTLKKNNLEIVDEVNQGSKANTSDYINKTINELASFTRNNVSQQKLSEEYLLQ